MLYNRFSDYLKNKYGSKVYKLPINLPCSCPNRDGRFSSEGCIFCGDEGAGFESLSGQIPVKEQLLRNAAYIGKNYGSSKFIAYFQNYSNTYMPLERFREYITDACTENIVALYISTRPDCMEESYIEFLEHIKESRGVDVVMELGLQTVNYKTLRLLNRGHTLAEFIDAVLRLNKHGLDSCAHYIVDLPMDNMVDVKEGAKILSALGVKQVKCHSMYILEGTKLGEMYKKGEIVPVTADEYIERVITFLEYLDPQIVVQRLLGRAPEERSLFCSWGTSWWKIREMVEVRMSEEGRHQGRYFDYLNGAACKFL